MNKTAAILAPAALVLGLGLSACASDTDTDTGVTTNTIAPGSTMSPSLGAPSMEPSAGLASPSSS